MCLTEKCALNWQSVTNNEMPTNALVGGYEIDKSPLYICRHTYNGDLLPGKASHRLGCHVNYKRREYELKSDYQVLVGSNVDWVPRHGADPVPKNAFQGGNTASGIPLYIGRCLVRGSNYETLIPGKIHYWFYYPFAISERKDCDNHQVLVCNVISLQ
jgi:hypothetical protein